MNISAVSSNLNANKLTAKISKVVNPQVKTKPDFFTKSVENISQKSPKLSKTLRTQTLIYHFLNTKKTARIIKQKPTI